MSLDKFIDDGIGLIIHPPPKEDVDKSEDPEDLEKYNQCHGYRGRFCSSGGGSGGSGGTAASGSGSPETYDEFNPDTGQTETYTMPPEIAAIQAEQIAAADKWRAEHTPEGMLQRDAPTLKPVYSDEVGLSKAEMREVKRAIERETERMGVQGLESVTIKHLDDSVSAQVGVSRVEAYRDKMLPVTYMEVSPNAVHYSGHAFNHGAVKRGELPWNASGFANNERAANASTFTHEMAHVKLGEYVAKKSNNELAALNGMNGDRSWEITVIKASRAGWEGPSKYGQTNYAECFAESATKYLLKGTSGNKSVDKYIEGVLKA